MLYFTIWLLGTWVASIDQNRLKITPIYGWGIFIMLTAGSRISHIYFDPYVNLSGYVYIQYLINLTVAVGFAVLVLSMRNVGKLQLSGNPMHKRMADFSYTIYLLHVPLLVFITAILSDKFNVPFFVQPTFQVLMQFLAIILFIYIVLYFFSLVTEKNTPYVKAYLVKLTARFRQSKQTGIA
jgi:peptidoglycan/LPS O-acetylase OafA/YrhL